MEIFDPQLSVFPARQLRLRFSFLRPIGFSLLLDIRKELLLERLLCPVLV